MQLCLIMYLIMKVMETNWVKIKIKINNKAKICYLLVLGWIRMQIYYKFYQEIVQDKK